jgi:hypothetical protein
MRNNWIHPLHCSHQNFLRLQSGGGQTRLALPFTRKRLFAELKNTDAVIVPRPSGEANDAVGASTRAGHRFASLAGANKECLQ